MRRTVRSRFLALAVSLLAAACLGTGVVAFGQEPLLGEQATAAIDAQRATIAALGERVASSAPEERAALVAEQAAALGELGRIFMSYQLAEEATEAFTRARELDGGDARFSYYLGLLAMESGDLERAVARFEEVTAAQPRDTAARLRLGNVLLELGRSRDARMQYERVLELEENSAAALAGLGRLDLEEDPRRAAAALEKALEQQPRAKRLHYFAAQAYRRLGDLEAAASHAERYGPGEVAFPEPLLQTLVLGGRDASFFVATGERAAAAGQVEYAEEAYRRALELAPDDARALEGLGNALESRGELEQAAATFDRALEADPDNARLLGHLGRVYVRLDRTKEARSALERALALDAGAQPARLLLAALSARDGDHEKALDLYEEVLAWDPQNRSALLARPQALLALGRAEDALAELRRLAEAWPESHGVRVNLATLLARTGDLDGATAELETLLESAEVETEMRGLAHYNLGTFDQRRGRAREARAHFERAVALDGDRVDARFQLAVMVARESPADAVPHLEKVLELEADHVLARLALTTALALEGRCDEARRAIEAGVRAVPDEVNLIHTFARLLVTCPTLTNPEPQLALELAQRAFSQSSTLEIGETVGMAFASSGAFDQAVRWQEMLLAEAVRIDDDAWSQRLRANLERYQNHERADP